MLAAFKKAPSMLAQDALPHWSMDVSLDAAELWAKMILSKPPMIETV